MGKKLKIESEKKKEKWNIFRSADEIMEQSGVLGAHTEIFGNSQITIEGCVGVYEYHDTYLKLRLSRGSIIITGSGFDIANFENRTITVKGKISSLEFSL